MVISGSVRIYSISALVRLNQSKPKPDLKSRSNKYSEIGEPLGPRLRKYIAPWTPVDTTWLHPLTLGTPLLMNRTALPRLFDYQRFIGIFKVTPIELLNSLDRKFGNYGGVLNFPPRALVHDLSVSSRGKPTTYQQARTDMQILLSRT